jgi:hypothetical protein
LIHISRDDVQPPYRACVFPLKTGHAVCGLAYAWNDLPATLDRMSDPRHGTRFDQPAAGKAQFQAMEIEIQVSAVHGRDG